MTEIPNGEYWLNQVAQWGVGESKEHAREVRATIAALRARVRELESQLLECRKMFELSIPSLSEHAAFLSNTGEHIGDALLRVSAIKTASAPDSECDTLVDDNEPDYPHTPGEKAAELQKHIARYDIIVRELVSYLQAFISHHRNPSFFLLPNIDNSENAWKRANDYNIIAARTSAPKPEAG